MAIVIGYDMRAGDPSAGSRSDTIMLVRVDPKKDAMTMLSFPRDLVVSHPGCEGHPVVDRAASTRPTPTAARAARCRP